MLQTWVHTTPALLSLQSKLKCSICERLPTNPHILWCKHSFCRECILRLPRCPKCDFSVTPQDIMPDIMLCHILRVMKITSEVINSESNTDSEINKPTTSINITSKGLTDNDNLYTDIKAKEKLTNSLSSKEKSSKKQASNNVAKCSDLTPKTPARSRKPSAETIHTPLSSITKRKVLNITPNSVNKSTKGHNFLTPKMKPPKSSSTPKPSILFSAKKTQITNKVNVKGESPLQIACRQGKLALVQKLLDDGAEPNVKDYANWTPLCDAVGSGKVEVVRALLSAGAAVNTPAHLNTTALVEAVLRRDEVLVRLLMLHGADPHQRTTLDNTAMSIADEHMKAVILSETGINVSPHPRVRTVPRVVLAMDLSQEQLEQVMRLCKTFNLTLSTAFTEDVTHLVVDLADGLCRASVNVMLGLASGCSVAGLDWVTASLDCGELLPVDNYEPNGTTDHPHSDAFLRSRSNREQLLPRLFDGCHISLTQEQTWPAAHRHDLTLLVAAAGAQFQSRACDAERVPAAEQTVMFHVPPHSPLHRTSHLVLYQPGKHEPLLKYNMVHVKSLSVAWFLQAIKTFSIQLEGNHNLQ